MTIFVAIKDLEHRLADLTARVEAGETVVLTRDGAPVPDWMPHKGAEPEKEAVEALPSYEAGLSNLEKGWACLRERGITNRALYR